MNPLYEQIGIAPSGHPPDYYALLGLSRFESDCSAIDASVQRLSRLVKDVQLKYPRESQDLLDEIARARVYLTDPDRKRRHDAALAPLPERTGTNLAGRAAGGSASRAKLLDNQGAPRGADDLSDASWFIPGLPSKSGYGDPQTEWIVGSGSDCEIRVRSKWVSRRHCLIQRSKEGAVVTDLGSTNGTYVNDVRIDEPAFITLDDSISLGRKTRVPWPLPVDCAGRDLRVYSIGRSAECDLVLEDPTVSKFHAQVVVEGASTTLHDLHSQNGTRIGGDGRAIGSCEILEHLPFFFGKRKVYGSVLLELDDAS